VADIEALARRIAPALSEHLRGVATCEVVDCISQIGSGALPTQQLASKAIAIQPAMARRTGGPLKRLAESFRDLRTPVIGRIHDGAFLLDMRCLEDERAFVDQLSQLRP
jgi:L-seryl-tRNA(Ser) seleniumtransferase